MDLSKAYDWLPHDLIIAKFEAYGPCKSSLSLLLDYLTSRIQRVKIDSSYSLWNEIKTGVPQGSFSMSLVMIFLCLLRKVRYAILLMTIYGCGEDLSNILENLKHDMKILLTWFRISSLQVSPGKFEFGQINTLIVNSTEIKESKKVVLLGITTDNFLTFNDHKYMSNSKL